MAISRTLNLNSERVTASVDDPDMPLLYVCATISDCTDGRGTQRRSSHFSGG
jgi:hypothetical protein